MKGRLGIAWLVMLTLSRVAFADVIADCQQQAQSKVRILACTEIIESASYGANEKASAYQSRGETRTDAGALRSALADFNAAISLNNDMSSAFAGRARAKFVAGNRSGAIADYSEAIRLSPNAPNLYIDRGHIYIINKKVDAAFDDFTAALRLDPVSFRAFAERALAHFNRGELDQAQEDLTAAIAIFPAAQFYANRGRIYEAQGKTAEAIDDLRRALLADPSLVIAWNALKRLGAEKSVTIETERHIREGKTLAEEKCAGCHSVSTTGISPNKDAPEFRNVYRRHLLFGLRQPITQAVTATHDQMPQFQLSGQQMDSVVAYINSLSAAK